MFYFWIVSFLGGIIIGLLGGGTIEIALWILLTTGFLLVWLLRYWLSVALCGVLMLVGIWRGQSFEITRLPFQEDEIVQVQGVVQSLSEAKGENRRYRIGDITAESKITGLIMDQYDFYLYVPYVRSIPFGSTISLTTKVQAIEPFLTETGKIFLYDHFLETRGVIGSIRFPRSLFVNDEIPQEKSFLITIKKRFVEQINTLFSFPNAPLLSGVLLGVVDTLGEKRLDDFRIAGLIHIVVLSGSNIAIIIEAVRRSLPLRRHFSIIVAGAFIFMFVMMVGPEASIVRAAIMAYVSLLAQATYSHYSVYRSLWMTIVGMVAWSPGIILYDPSFILSALATMGMVYVNPIFERRFSLIPERFEMRFIMASTCATYIAVLPYITYSMGKVSIVSLGVNLITLPLVPWIMLGGFVATCVSFMSEFLARPLVLITEVLLTYIQKIVEIFANLPFAEVSFSMGMELMLLLYVSLVVWFLIIKRGRPEREGSK